VLAGEAPAIPFLPAEEPVWDLQYLVRTTSRSPGADALARRAQARIGYPRVRLSDRVLRQAERAISFARAVTAAG
jgi:hypothetical protein